MSSRIPTVASLIVTLGALMVLGACAEQPDAERSAATSSGTAATEDPAPPDATRASPEPMFSEEGLVDQLRTYFPEPDTMPSEWEPGPGAWVEEDVPEGFAEAAGGTPAELMTAYVAETGLNEGTWETTVRVLDEDPDDERASAAVLRWGLRDDAVAGTDTRLELRRGEDGWRIEHVESRPRCARGVTDGLCL